MRRTGPTGRGRRVGDKGIDLSRVRKQALALCGVDQRDARRFGIDDAINRRTAEHLGLSIVRRARSGPVLLEILEPLPGRSRPETAGVVQLQEYWI
jgi:hypothetical protein